MINIFVLIFIGIGVKLTFTVHYIYSGRRINKVRFSSQTPTCFIVEIDLQRMDKYYSIEVSDRKNNKSVTCTLYYYRPCH